MRMLIGLAVLAMIAAPASAAVPVDNNPDVNNGGLINFTNQQPDVWIMSGTGAPGEQDNDRSGPDGSDMRVGGTWNLDYDQTYTQEFAVSPGNYDIHVEGWTKVWSGNYGVPSDVDATISLLIDGAAVWTSPSATWDTWVLQSADLMDQAVNSTIGVQLHAVSSGGNGPWSHARFDDVTLSYVPEPATAMLLGFASLVVLRRRR